MSNVGDIERLTKNRVVALFRDQRNYDYIGNWKSVQTIATSKMKSFANTFQQKNGTAKRFLFCYYARNILSLTGQLRLYACLHLRKGMHLSRWLPPLVSMA